MSILRSALKKKNMAKHDKNTYQNSDYRLTKKEQESLSIMRILLVLPILLMLVLYVAN
jgi:hypothetical protein